MEETLSLTEGLSLTVAVLCGPEDVACHSLAALEAHDRVGTTVALRACAGIRCAYCFYIVNVKTSGHVLRLIRSMHSVPIRCMVFPT